MNAQAQRLFAKPNIHGMKMINGDCLEALRVAKPGAFLLAFGGTRTFHRLASAIEHRAAALKYQKMLAYL